MGIAYALDQGFTSVSEAPPFTEFQTLWECLNEVSVFKHRKNSNPPAYNVFFYWMANVPAGAGAATAAKRKDLTKPKKKRTKSQALPASPVARKKVTIALRTTGMETQLQKAMATDTNADGN